MTSLMRATALAHLRPARLLHSSRTGNLDRAPTRPFCPGCAEARYEFLSCVLGQTGQSSAYRPCRVSPVRTKDEIALISHTPCASVLLYITSGGGQDHGT